MSRRVFQLVAGLVLILAALTPLMECFDHWDKHPGPTNDTEIRLTAWFVGVGVVLTLAVQLRQHISALAAFKSILGLAFTCRPTPLPQASRRIEPTGSPPLVLLTPLRI